ncbi:M3 family metallopeptidase [Puniceicoccales bacterium CK1056]|uniref:oligopeptidase A n=1 Tax=Oceanipulchritudo coccoides TaxID=2706888 RepID=A0A6B2LYZ5_9BACT|nr:M3 family metallopeptidase [Oceanipulchritudo coccoides]NDV61382.1 M3 family metallopeptidase [Oceanipulchritudo coccoides]
MSTTQPFLKKEFAVNWTSLTADHVVPDMEAAIEQGSAALAVIESLKDGEETFANTFLALEVAGEIVSAPWSKVNHLDSVNDHPELRKAHKEVLPKVSAYFSAIPLNQKLYAKLRNFRAGEGFDKLGKVEKRFVEETLKDFEDAGANQDDKTRDRLQAIEATLAKVTKQFSENVLDSTNKYEKIVESVDELKGLPESFIESARLSALSKGQGTEESPKYRFTLQAPSFFPVLRFADSDSLRKELYEASANVANTPEFDNEPLIREIITLRNEKAKLLGRKVFPDWVLSRRMAKSGAQALQFVEDLHKKTLGAFNKENEELMAYKAAKTGGEKGPLHPWEMSYWAEKLRLETYDFDEEILRPYFPVQSVMTGMFALVEKIFGICVEEQTDPKPNTWHESVQLYKVTDASSGRHLGSFYADWFPRETKRGGAWMNGLITGKSSEGGELSPHLGFIAGNLTPPVGDKPALLNHRDVETVFHEFGHLLHHVLSEVKIRSLCGTNVAWDFVELPSQIMENWCWERESLDLFARHYETGEPIPEELFQKMKKARNFGAGGMQMRQLCFAKLDLALHLRFDPEQDKDFDAFVNSEIDEYLPPMSKKYPSMARRFEHLFSSSTGYASGYYSYKWAEVLDADAFTRFTNEGILNQQTGLAFRNEVLARGNSDQPENLFRSFMGRDPDPEALLIRLGLKASA